MRSFLARLAHAVAITGQVFNSYGGIIPQKHQGPVAVGIGLAQLVIGHLQHNSNPDGTPAALPFKPPVVPPKINFS